MARVAATIIFFFFAFPLSIASDGLTCHETSARYGRPSGVCLGALRDFFFPPSAIRFFAKSKKTKTNTTQNRTNDKTRLCARVLYEIKSTAYSVCGGGSTRWGTKTCAAVIAVIPCRNTTERYYQPNGQQCVCVCVRHTISKNVIASDAVRRRHLFDGRKSTGDALRIL